MFGEPYKMPKGDTVSSQVWSYVVKNSVKNKGRIYCDVFPLKLNITIGKEICILCI